MTIDEAIEHAREVAKRNREQYKNCPADRIDIEHQTCAECAKEHEQLAEWLEELKSYRQYIDLTEIPEQYKLGFQDGIIAGYNKAIDDLVEKAGKLKVYNQIFLDDLSMVAEQLKESGVDE